MLRKLYCHPNFVFQVVNSYNFLLDHYHFKESQGLESLSVLAVDITIVCRLNRLTFISFFQISESMTSTKRDTRKYTQIHTHTYTDIHAHRQRCLLV